jgi:hypothetical protein
MENILGSNHGAKIINKLVLIKKAPTFVDAFLIIGIAEWISASNLIDY